MVRTLLFALLFIPAGSDAHSQEGYPPFHEEIVVTPTLRERQAFELPVAVTVADEEEIARAASLSLVDALDDRIGVWIEKRTTSTGDPVMRGLSGSNILALVDGNTLSTFWGEGGDAGDDMYGKIDPESVERIEVIRGPRSVLYGTNALGGVLSFITRSCPLEFPRRGARWGASLRPGYASAARERRFRQEFFGATPGFRFLLGASVRDVGDVRPGEGGRQIPTGAEEANWDGKAEWLLAGGGRLILAAQDVHRNPVYRFYRPEQDNVNDREALSLIWSGPSAFADACEVRAYAQKKEDRRRFLSQGIVGTAKTKTLSFAYRAFRSTARRHDVTYGLQYESDWGESADDEQFTLRYPDGRVEKASPDTRWQGFGFFVQDEWRLSQRFGFVGALRIDRFLFDADPDEHYHPPGGWDPARDDISEKQTALTGGLGVAVRLSGTANLVANYGRGYRLWAPQFGLTQRGEGVVIPSGLLDPVTGDTFEIGIKAQGGWFRGSGFAYHTRFDDWQTTKPATFQGSDWYDFDGDGRRGSSETVYQTVPAGSARVYGVELEAEADLSRRFSIPKGFSLGAGFAWNRGEITSLGEPLRHTQPAEGRLKILWERPDLPSRPWVRLTTAFVGRFTRIASDRLLDDPGYRSDPQDPASPLVRPYGLPGYSVFDLRGGFRIGRDLEVILGVENFLDKRYRQAHSRWDEPGINAVVSIRWTPTW